MKETTKTNKDKQQQCKYCINVLTSQQRMANHIVAKHPEKQEEWVKNG